MILTHSKRLVEPQPLVKLADLLNLLFLQIEAADIQVLRKPVLVIALRNDSDAPLRRPPQQNLRRRLALLLRDLLDHRVLQQRSRDLGLCHVELEKALRPEGRVRGDGDALGGAQVDQLLLRQERVVLDLKCGRADAGVAQQVEYQAAAVVGDADAARQPVVHKALHRVPGRLERCSAGRNLVVFVFPAWRVADGGVDVLEGDGEVDDV